MLAILRKDMATAHARSRDTVHDCTMGNHSRYKVRVASKTPVVVGCIACDDDGFRDIKFSAVARPKITCQHEVIWDIASSFVQLASLKCSIPEELKIENNTSELQRRGSAYAGEKTEKRRPIESLGRYAAVLNRVVEREREIVVVSVMQSSRAMSDKPLWGTRSEILPIL